MIPKTFAPVLLLLALVRSSVLTLPENAGVARPNEPVSFGIPFKMGELPSQTMGLDAPLALAGIPAQFKVLSNWHDGSARWVLATFMTDFAANENKGIAFGRGAGSTAGTNMTVTDRNDTITINTGVIRAEILKGNAFNLLNRVWRGNELVVDNTGMGGLRLTADTANGDSNTYKGVALQDSVIIEEEGPVRACIYIAGGFFNGATRLKASGPINCDDNTHKQGPPYTRFMARICAYNNSDEIKVTTVLHNTGTAGLVGQGAGSGGPVTYVYSPALQQTWAHCDDAFQPLYFREMYYDMNTRLGSNRTAATENNVTTTLSAADRFSFLQASPDNYYVFKNAGQSASGSRGLGFMDLSNGSLGVTAALKYCWEAYPKRIDLFGDTLRMNFFPRDIAPADTFFSTDNVYGTACLDKWQKCYVLPPGGWFRNDVFFRFHNGSCDAEGFARARRNPVMPKFEDRYLHATQAIQGFYSDTLRFLEPAGSLAQRLFERKRIWSGIMYDYTLTEDKNNTSGHPRESLWEHWDKSGRLSWGELNMGDLRWGNGFCNLHYDQANGLLHSYLRTGDYKAWQVAQMMGSRRANLTQYHHMNGTPTADGFSNYEKHDHMNGYISPRGSHHWCEGLGLYYSLTGDEFTGTAFTEAVDASFWSFVRALSPGMTGTAVIPEVRFIGWSLLNLCAGYWTMSDEKYYDMLKVVVRQSLLPTEQASGPGFWSDADTTWDQMAGYVGTPLVYLYHTLKPSDTGLKDTLASLIHRLWQRGESKKLDAGAITATHFKTPKYTDLSLDLIGQTDYYAFAWRHFGDPSAREQAMRNAMAIIGYHQRFGWSDSVALDYYSPAIFESNMYSASETKLHGKIGLHARKLMEYEYDSLVPVQPGDGMLTEVAVEKGRVGVSGALLLAAPNPFNPVSRITLSLTQASDVDLKVVDLSGRLIKTLAKGDFKAGSHVFTWNARDDNGRHVATGVYLYKMVSGNKVLTCKTIMAK